MRNPGKQKEVKPENFNNISKKQKKLRADRIRKKYFRLSRALRKCDSVQDKKNHPKLNVEYPATVKMMVKGNVSGGFFLRLPLPFCKAHIPVKNPTIMVLETDTGERYEAKYLPHCYGLSGGWRRFAIDMKLEQGDTLIFQLVQPTKFKIFFIRVNSTNEVHFPVYLLNLVNRVKERVSSKAGRNQQSFYNRGEVHHNYLQRKIKELRAKKFWRKDLVVPQVLGKGDLVHAKNIQSELDFEHPVTVKWLMKGNISRGGTLALPAPYCRAHLPVIVTNMVLETETGEQYTTKYLPQSCRLSAGWFRFVTKMRLEEGDAVVLHLIEAAKFKVYIIRANAKEVNLPNHLLDLLSHVKQSIPCKADSRQLIVYTRKVDRIEQQLRWKSARLKSRNGEGSILVGQGVLFSNITSFEEFKAVMNKLIQNHQLPHYALHDYYQLCCNQNAFLHAHLFRGFNPRLNNQIIAGAITRIILDTVNIANELSTCKLSTFLQKYELWDQSLKTYEAYGMNVSFILARLQHLKNLAVSSEGATDRSRYEEACHENERAKGEVRKLDLILAKLQTLELKLGEETYRQGYSLAKCVKAEIGSLEVLIQELGEFLSQYDAHIQELKLKVKAHEYKFHEKVSTPWLHLYSPTFESLEPSN
ncbi:hypothetical protein SOVF_139420 [Spinacia oleracea]|uniref:B3 domain-containing protein Os01g0234100 n=1 Tax=Spinacia oleracea TaxID=3562 RepID=A0ABM3QIE9_SPIOL|nr:B3 domain-containing protein Os01g0234100-like [Spinacia oleracea]KNA10957.1 hypothetical protein SOVF_139420 [Spinacia oleracea]